MAECPAILDADIRRELTADVVAQAKAGLGVAQPGPDTDLATVLSREIDLGTRLEDQALGDALVVITRRASHQLTLIRQEQCAFDVEEAWCEPLETDHRVSPRRIRLEVVADPALNVEIRTDRAAVERLDFGFFDRTTDIALAFRLDPQPVDVAAIPGRTVPLITVAATASLVFRDVEHDLRILLPAVPRLEVMTSHGHPVCAEDSVGGMVGRNRRRRSVASGQIGPRGGSTGHTAHVVAGHRFGSGRCRVRHRVHVVTGMRIGRRRRTSGHCRHVVTGMRIGSGWPGPCRGALSRRGRLFRRRLLCSCTGCRFLGRRHDHAGHFHLAVVHLRGGRSSKRGRSQRRDQAQFTTRHFECLQPSGERSRPASSLRPCDKGCGSGTPSLRRHRR